MYGLYVYAYIYKRTYVHICVCWIYKHVFTHVHTCLWVGIYTCLYAYIYTYTYIHIYVYIYIYVYVCIYTYLNTCKYWYIVSVSFENFWREDAYYFLCWAIYPFIFIPQYHVTHYIYHFTPTPPPIPLYPHLLNRLHTLYSIHSVFWKNSKGRCIWFPILAMYPFNLISLCLYPLYPYPFNPLNPCPTSFNSLTSIPFESYFLVP
jgi:hypothetical protein